MEEKARMVHDMHHGHCPVYRSLYRCIGITTELELMSE
jgi:hypothetical protein